MALELEGGSYASPRWSYEILDCAMPMSFDTYSNCAHQCLYCFSFFQRAIGNGADDYLHHKVRSVNVDKVKRMFTDPDKYAGQFAGYIKRRMVLQWGGLSDGFDWYEKKFGKSLELMRFFREIDYPVSISTKGVWFVDDDRYKEVFKGAKNVHFKYSIITDDEEMVKQLEPGTPTAKARFEAMRKLNKLGIGASTLRFRPFVLGASDLVIDSMFETGADVGCYSVTTEFLAWEGRASTTSRARLDAMSKALGYDVWKFYLENSARASGLLRLNYDLKRPYILRMKEKAEEVGLKFFVSDAHHKEDSYHAGCCGLPETGPLSNVNRGQYAHAIKLAKENGFVKWSDIGEEAYALLNDIDFVEANGEGFPGDSDERAKRRFQTMYDYMHDIWNNPKSWQSPARYFGGALVPSNLDDNGDIVYLYNKPFIEDGLRINSANQLAIQLRMAGKPNAERYDEMVQDGGNFGHVAYPVYVFSRARYNYASTPKLLDNARINYHLVVREVELKAYQAKFPDVDIIVLPEEVNPTITSAKQYIYDMCKEEGYPYVWMLDDDIATVYKQGEKVSIRAMLSGVEKFLEDYLNVAMAGVVEYNVIENTTKPFEVNAVVRGATLVNLMTGIDFTFQLPYPVYEDMVFTIMHLTTGKWTTVQLNEYSVKYNESIGGGMSNIYNVNNKVNDVATQLNKVFPQHTAVEPMPAPFGGKLTIQTNTFQSSLKSKNVELFITGE